MGTGDKLFTIKQVKDFLELLVKTEDIIKEVAPLDKQISVMKKSRSKLEEVISSLSEDTEKLKKKYSSIGSEIPKKQEAAALKHKEFIEGLRREEREAKERTARTLSTLGRSLADAEEKARLKREKLNKEIKGLEDKLSRTKRAVENIQQSLGDVHVGGVG